MQKHFWFRQHQSLEEKELADYKAFSCWSQTKYGQGLLEQQQKQVYPHIYRNWQLSQFGSVQYDLCLIGPHASIQLFQPLQAQAAKIGFHWLDVGHEWPIGSEDTNSVFVDRFRAWDNQPSVFQAASYHLPFAEESMQLVVVYHVLDLATYPQSVIAELARIVRKGGELIIFGFNPFSLWGVIRSICWFHHQPPWCCHFIRPGRLMDWLSVLHFENWQVDSQFMSQRGRETQTNLKARLRSLYQDQRLVQVTSRLQASLRSTYCLHITKRISPLTPIKNKIGLPRLIGLANQSSIVTDLSSARSPQGDINS